MLVFLFAAYALVGGVLALIRSLRRDGNGGSPIGGRSPAACSCRTGLVAFAMPTSRRRALLVIALGDVGAIELVAAYQLRDVIRGEWLLALDGVVAIIFGFLLIAFPSAGALAVVLADPARRVRDRFPG